MDDLGADPALAKAEPVARLGPSGFDPGDIWSEHLTDAQLRMVMESGDNERLGGGFGVELIGSGAWATARSLVAKGLGSIEGGAPNGSSLPGLYFNDAEGCRIVHEFDEGEDEE